MRPHNPVVTGFLISESQLLFIILKEPNLIGSQLNSWAKQLCLRLNISNRNMYVFTKVILSLRSSQDLLKLYQQIFHTLVITLMLFQ